MSRAFLVDIVLAPMLDVAGAIPTRVTGRRGSRNPDPHLAGSFRVKVARPARVAPGSPQGSPGPSSRSGLAQVQVRTGGDD